MQVVGIRIMERVKSMKRRLFFVLLALGALGLAFSIGPLLTAIHAQQRGTQPGAAGAGQQGGRGQAGTGGGRRGNTPTFPGPPAGMQALSTDMFTSKNFYKDKA